MILQILVFLTVCLQLAAPRAGGKVYVDPATQSLRDANGAQLLLHGVNVVYKLPPYVPSQGPFDPQNSLNEQDMADLRSWGVNFVRLGVMWEAVETSEGVYNTTYLNELNDLIYKLGEYGIYTMLDAHQDASSRLTCGEGFPTFQTSKVNSTCADWSDPAFDDIKKVDTDCMSIDDYDYIADSQGWPEIAECLHVPFFKYYTTIEAMAVFEQLYHETDTKAHLQTSFINFWKAVAPVFKNNTWVIGFDPVNEPALGANFQHDTTLLEQGEFDKRDLTPFYEKIYEAYTKEDPEAIMYFETAQYPDSGLGKVNHTGFVSPPGGQNNSAYHVLNDHTYCCQLGGDVCETGEPAVDKAEECAAFHKLRIDTRAEDAKLLGIPFIITEFGACLDSDVCAREITQVGEAADAVLAGWAYWQFKIFKDITTTAKTSSEGFYNQDANSTLQHRKVKALARTYIQKTQGTLTHMLFNTSTASFTAHFSLDTSVHQCTLIYMNKQYYYPTDPTFTVTNLDTNHILKEADYSIAYGNNTACLSFADQFETGMNFAIEIGNAEAELSLLDVTASGGSQETAPLWWLGLAVALVLAGVAYKRRGKGEVVDDYGKSRKGQDPTIEIIQEL